MVLEADQIQDTANIPDRASDQALSASLTPIQLGEIRDEWLRPFMVQLRHQSEEVGRLEMQVKHLRDERDRLALECDALHGQLAELDVSGAGVELADTPEAQAEISTVAQLLTQLQTAEGAMVIGIVIALGLWMTVGLLTWFALG